MKSLSRRPAAARATISSATPLPYISAVSIRLTPSSMPSFKAASSSAARRRSSPICQVPWPKAETDSPLGRVTDGWVISDLLWGALAAQKDEPRGAVDALVYDGEAGRHRQILARRDLDHNKRVGGQPAGGGERRQGRFGKPALVRRVEERDGTGKSGARRPGRIAGDDTGAVRFAKRADIAAQRGERLALAFDERSFAGAARQGFQTDRAGAGKG